MVIDVHCHSTGREKTKDVLAAMDSQGVDRIFLFSPPPKSYRTDKKMANFKHADGMKHVAKVAKGAGGRIYPFLWIDPLVPTAARDVVTGAKKYGIRGYKMIPNGWFPYDKKVQPVLRAIAKTGLPVLLHSGILWGFGDCSRFNRPCNFEILMEINGLRFALAHVSWPWTDECLAVFGKFEAQELRGFAGAGSQMYIDCTPGTPPVYRKPLFALMRKIGYGCAEKIMFGVDARGELYGHGQAKKVLRMDRRALRRVGFSRAQREAYFSGNALRFVEG